MSESGNLLGGSVALMSKALDLRATQHKLTAANVTNIDTPGYRGFDMALDKALRELDPVGEPLPLSRTQPGHLGGLASGSDPAAAAMHPTAEITRRQDRNGVDIDSEMTQLAANQLMYSTLTRMLSRKFQSLRSVIAGGSK